MAEKGFYKNAAGDFYAATEGEHNMDVVFIDSEIHARTKEITDLGALKIQLPNYLNDGFHANRRYEFAEFIRGAEIISGHNIINFDIKYLSDEIKASGVERFMDTLLLSPLFFSHPHHNLLKNDKLINSEANNPLSDAKKSRDLYMDLVTAFLRSPEGIKRILYTLLKNQRGFDGFFYSLSFNEESRYLPGEIRQEFFGLICDNVDLSEFIENYPIELSYALSFIYVNKKESNIPPFVRYNYPKVQDVYNALRNVPCEEGCSYCSEHFDIKSKLKKYFGYDEFRLFDGENLQEKAVLAAVGGKSILAVFPTGGGKSITFQLPALIAAETVHGLTVVISPLQSLMKDQVDNLSKRGLAEAVTINGLLNPLERSAAIKSVEDGTASILYISPESLRKGSIKRLLLSRHIARFVIDEAHCFSSWGQDFRIDYQYIGTFIRKLEEEKKTKIPISCFTATAKQKVISDIREYFREKTGAQLLLYTTSSARKNLRYEVIPADSPEDKYQKLRHLLSGRECPAIVYASRTKRTEELADNLCRDGFNAVCFHGQLDPDVKVKHQEAFMNGEVQIVVATSAFGMGVDKKDVGLVIHYDISDSLENYVQEAGRAGRDESINADCYILYNDSDLDKHFTMLNQTKLNIREIQQLWRAIKNRTKNRDSIVCSALELARDAGWDENGRISDLETKVKSAINALEESGYILRKENIPRVFADSIRSKNMIEASRKIRETDAFTEVEKSIASAIMSNLLSCRAKTHGGDDGETRVDYIADHMGLETRTVISIVERLRSIGVLEDKKEIYTFVTETQLNRKGINRDIEKNIALELFLLDYLEENNYRISYKDANEAASQRNIRTGVPELKRLVYFWIIKKYIKKPEIIGSERIEATLLDSYETTRRRIEKRHAIATRLDEYFLRLAEKEVRTFDDHQPIKIAYSVLNLKNYYNEYPAMFTEDYLKKAANDEIEETLLYLSKTDAFKIEGSFLVIYNALSIKKLEKNNRVQYKKEDYRDLENYYSLRREQIHIVGEYANMMLRDIPEAIQYVKDYFDLEYTSFLKKYFAGEKLDVLSYNMTPQMSKKLYEGLTEKQKDIIRDDDHEVVVVAAGPGSGKTKILVHKMAEILLQEDIKQEQLLVLTFSRAAAMEFRERLYKLLDNPYIRVEIKTFHSYAFDLLGRMGKLDDVQDVVKEATEVIKNRETEFSRITKSVIILDEAQDISEEEYEMVKALLDFNHENSEDGVRLIAVGDDDQCIFGFRGASAQYMNRFLDERNSMKYEMTENFRSKAEIINYAEAYISCVENRLKTAPLVSRKPGPGKVIEIKTGNTVSDMPSILKEHYHPQAAEKTAILTDTNEKAGLIASVLKENGYNPRLLRFADDVKLYDLDEIRYLLSVIPKDSGPLIPKECYKESIGKLNERYLESRNLVEVNRALKKFLEDEELYAGNDRIYKNDLFRFLNETKMGEYDSDGSEELLISTIHKSKGRQFDRVFLHPFTRGNGKDDIRRINYVGMTRAKNELYIVEKDGKGELKKGPKEICVPLRYKDIWLSFGDEKADEKGFSDMKSGDTLRPVFKSGKLYFAVGKKGFVAAASKIFCEEVAKYRRKNYYLERAVINYVVHWYEREKGCERIVILPEVTFRKEE